MNVEQLIQEIESRFDCEMGPAAPRVYYEGQDFDYQSIRLSADDSVLVANPGASVESLLCKALLAKLPAPAKGEKLKLFWRTRPVLQRDFETHRTYLRARFVIPGVDLDAKIEGEPSEVIRG